MICRRMSGTGWQRGLIAFLFALPLFVTGAAADEAEIRRRLEDWTAAFNARDARVACELFSRSLISEVQGQGETNYETRCALITKALTDRERSFRYGLEIKEIIVEGGLAVVRLTWTLTVSPGNSVSIEPGLDIFRKESDGAWRIIRYIAHER